MMPMIQLYSPVPIPRTVEKADGKTFDTMFLIKFVVSLPVTIETSLV